MSASIIDRLALLNPPVYSAEDVIELAKVSKAHVAFAELLAERRERLLNPPAALKESLSKTYKVTHKLCVTPEEVAGASDAVLLLLAHLAEQGRLTGPQDTEVAISGPRKAVRP